MQRSSTVARVHNGSSSSSESRKKSGSVCVCVRAHSLGAQRGQAEPNELQKSVCCEVRESNIPLELCVYTALREGGWQGGSKRGLQERKQIKSRLHCMRRYLPAGPHRLLIHYRRSSAWPARMTHTVYHNLVFRNFIPHLKHGSGVSFTVAF